MADKCDVPTIITPNLGMVVSVRKVNFVDLGVTTTLEPMDCTSVV